MKLTFSIKFVSALLIQLAIIIILATSATIYINRLAINSENIVKDNLRSVKYCAGMEQSLFMLHYNQDILFARAEFENHLMDELNNITEPDERDIANHVQSNWFQWLTAPTDELYSQMLNDINQISEINVTAIENKNLTAQDAANRARTNIIILAFFSVIVALLFTFIAIGQVLNPFGKRNIKQTLSEELSRTERMQ